MNKRFKLYYTEDKKWCTGTIVDTTTPYIVKAQFDDGTNSLAEDDPNELFELFKCMLSKDYKKGHFFLL